MAKEDGEMLLDYERIHYELLKKFGARTLRGSESLKFLLTIARFGNFFNILQILVELKLVSCSYGGKTDINPYDEISKAIFKIKMVFNNFGIDDHCATARACEPLEITIH